MNFEGLDGYREAAESACRLYPWGKERILSLLHLSENATFLMNRAADGEPAQVMRVSRIGYHRAEEIRAELRWLLRLQGGGRVKTVSPIANSRGELLTRIRREGQTFVCVVFEYLRGRNPDPRRDLEASEDFFQVGRIAALLHRDTMDWAGSRKLDRPHLDCDAMLGPGGLFGDWRQCKELDERGTRLLEQTCLKVRERLLGYGKRRTNYGLIHADLRAANLLKSGGRIWVMDFDDCGFGWHLYDLAASFSFLEDDDRIKLWIDAWVKGYGTVLTLSEEDLREIPTFLMARRIQLLAWLTSHEDSDPVRELYPGFAGRTVSMAENYLKGGLIYAAGDCRAGSARRIL
ncbi:MAG: phosphotransferase [Hungatella sp.]|nr:phosphotransferase [Hungatella sp.]